MPQRGPLPSNRISFAILNKLVAMVLSWLLAFGVVNRYNRGVSVIGDFLYRVTEPALRPIRSFLPNFGGVDISPIILILILMFLRRLILYDLAPSIM